MWSYWWCIDVRYPTFTEWLVRKILVSNAGRIQSSFHHVATEPWRTKNPLETFTITKICVKSFFQFLLHLIKPRTLRLNLGVLGFNCAKMEDLHTYLYTELASIGSCISSVVHGVRIPVTHFSTFRINVRLRKLNVHLFDDERKHRELTCMPVNPPKC